MTDSTPSTVREWPYRPDFNQFKRQAKELLKAYREIGDEKVRAAFLATLKAAASRKH